MIRVVEILKGPAATTPQSKSIVFRIDLPSKSHQSSITKHLQPAFAFEYTLMLLACNAFVRE